MLKRLSKLDLKKTYEKFSYAGFILTLAIILFKVFHKASLAAFNKNFDLVYLALAYFYGTFLSAGMTKFLGDRSFNHKFYGLLAILLLILFYPTGLGVDDKKLMLGTFFIAGLLFPIFSAEIKESLLGNKKQLETILAIAIIITLPLATGILKKVQSDNETIKNATELTIKIYTGESQWQQDNSTEKYLHTEDFVQSIPLCKANVDCRELENEQSEKLDNIYDQFIHHSLWVSRAKAAYLLRFATNGKIAKTNQLGGLKVDWRSIVSSLVNTMVNEKENRVVRKTALDTFRYLVPSFQEISPFPTTKNLDTMFDFNKAKKYWDDHPEIIEQLEKSK